ncbi:phage tail assembly protein [Achromobacter denitrificans]|uniref:phage tail assembly protein n=1 Tax=Achromobacter denitrificans TaxID=32002 RepID=UPI000F66C5D7|nr:phage tail assembly protein [Achromobacter denitrificans]RSE76660.1 phage tail assembly protein [Achromobacter denitrificans]
MTNTAQTTPATEAVQPHDAPAIANPDVQVVVLDYPIKRSSGDITQLTIRKPKAGALRGVTLMALAQIDVQSLKTVLPRICDPILAPGEIIDMDPADLMSVGATVASFFLSKADKSAFQTS